MICPQCGNDNPSRLKFCVKCGMNLENPAEVNYEQVDMGGYHAEEDPDAGGFSFGSGTFTISDRAPSSSTTSDLYTADELNDDDEEFDFSSYDEPFIPKLDTDRVSLPSGAAPQPQMNSIPQQPGMYGFPQPQMTGMPQMNGMPAIPQMNNAPQMGGIPTAPQMNNAPQMGGIPTTPQMNNSPQMGGMPQMNGMLQQGVMPMYGQPMMFAQPQIIGYDPSGLPIYSQPQPIMYTQPQIIGYDQNGMPVYSQPQPIMYAQPQIIGYDQNGMPVYGQPAAFPQPDPSMQGMYQMPQQPVGYSAMNGMPQMNSMPGMQQFGAAPPPPPQPPQPQQEDPGRVNVPDDFWKFFDGGKSKAPENDGMDDFFGKHSEDMSGDPEAAFGQLHKKSKPISYMNDTPLVDADDLVPNTAAKFNKMYMRKTETVNADELEAHDQTKTQDIMGVTREVDADQLNSYEHYKTHISMSSAGEADADELEAYVHEHTEAIMSQDITAVEALPKKQTTYNDDIDAIELPEYMQARKAVNDDSPEIPELPEF